MMMTRRVEIRLLVIVACLTAMWFAPSVWAGTRVCTKEEAIAAETAAPAQSWEQLHQQFKRYSHCDDGAIGEGFSESVTLLLADRWQDIRQLGEILSRDSAFRKFVIRHINETVPVERLNRIIENANKLCPRSLRGLCRDIETTAKKSAQAEMKVNQ